MSLRRITYDSQGTPAVWADDAAGVYEGIGFLHGLHRPLQTLLIATGGRAELAARLAPRSDLVELDALSRRLGIPERARAEAVHLTARARSWLEAYVAGCAAGLRRGGLPFELRLLAARLPPPTIESVLGAQLLGAFLGLAGGQERMERALIDSLCAGADPRLLERMFTPHLEGWEPSSLARVPRRSGPGMPGQGIVAGPSGSNAWAVTGARSRSGKPVLAGDPHLQVNQMPALLFEVRARVGDDWWLGATIAGLPAIAVGRTRRLAWSGTFGVADNVDFTLEQLDGRGARRGPDTFAAVVEREVVLRRRFASPLRLRFLSTDRGVLDGDGPTALASQWAGAERAAEAIEAYLALPLAATAAEAEATLGRAHSYSLHWVLADRDGDVRYRQSGRIPRRPWSGLYPVRGDEPRHWTGFFEGDGLPRAPARDGLVASANEGRPGAGGETLSTLAQPDYRLRRIEQVLRGSSAHDLASFAALQLDVVSLQGERLRPRFVAALPYGPVRDALVAWDLSCDAASVGAHAFQLAYGAARLGLAPELGGEWLETQLARSELGVWWAKAIDDVLADDVSWQGDRGARLRASIGEVARSQLAPWGDVQKLRMPHMVLGGLPLGGLDRGPFPLPGSLATVRQGTVTRPGGREMVTAPAYRFVCDLAEDGASSSLPGGIDGSRFAGTYDRWLGDYLEGRYHRLEPPREDERPLAE
jgi:penicillin amidase